MERLEVVGDESMRRATSREERVWLTVTSSQRGESAGDTAARAGFTGGMKLQAAETRRRWAEAEDGWGGRAAPAAPVQREAAEIEEGESGWLTCGARRLTCGAHCHISENRRENQPGG